MASRNFDDLQILGKMRKVLCGSFKPNGASAPVAASNTGVGWTVAHTGGSNDYIVTFQDTYFAVDCVLVHLESATLGQAVQVTAEPTTTSFTCKAYTTSTGSAINDLAAGTNTRVHFIAILKNTSGNF